MSLKQPFPPVAAPMVDTNGAPTQIWSQFFLSLFYRTNGAAGPAAPLTGNDAGAIAGLTASVAGANANAASAASAATDASASAATALALAVEAKTLSIMGDVETPRNDDQAAFTAQLIAD